MNLPFNNSQAYNDVLRIRSLIENVLSKQPFFGCTVQYMVVSCIIKLAQSPISKLRTNSQPQTIYLLHNFMFSLMWGPRIQKPCKKNLIVQIESNKANNDMTPYFINLMKNVFYCIRGVQKSVAT